MIVGEFYGELLDGLRAVSYASASRVYDEPTGWPRVDRSVAEIRIQLARAGTEEQFQAVGLYCRETLISLAQANYEPLTVVRHVLERLDINLNEAKTHILDATDASFHFLGFTVQMSRGAKTGKPYPSVRPSDKALRQIKARLTERTRRELTVIPLADVVENVNRSLRGWVNYFHYRNSSGAMHKVRQHAEQRRRVHLRKRHKSG